MSPYQKIESSLRTRVREGDWAGGQSLPGRRKLAQEYGVALSTVQRAISSLIEDGTLETDGTLGTFVAHRPPELEALPGDTEPGGIPIKIRNETSAQSRRIRIGILIDNYAPPEGGEQTENSFYGPLFDGIRSSLAREDVYVNYVFPDGRSLRDLHNASECDGLIVIAPAIQTLYELKSLQSAGVPFVALLTSIDPNHIDGDLPCVDADNRAGATQAVDHLIELGHKDIGIVNLALSQTDLCDRLLGFLSCMAKAGLTVNPAHMLIRGYPWNESVFEAQIAEWISAMRSTNTLPSAIFCCDLTMTLMTLSSLQRHGLKVPDDVSIVGFDDTSFADHTFPPLTLVRQPVYQMGWRAAAKLLDHLRTSSGPISGTELLPTQLIVRRSTSAPTLARV